MKLNTNKIEKIHISNIVSLMNRGNHDYVIYDKHKKTMDEIESEMSSWMVITGDDKTIVAFVKVHDVNWLSRTVWYSIVFSIDHNRKKVLRQILLDLFSIYNCNKLVTDIIYDRGDTVKDHIFLGGNIEVRKRQHLYINGKYVHVVEMAVFKNELKDE